MREARRRESKRGDACRRFAKKRSENKRRVVSSEPFDGTAEQLCENSGKIRMPGLAVWLEQQASAERGLGGDRSVYHRAALRRK